MNECECEPLVVGYASAGAQKMMPSPPASKAPGVSDASPKARPEVGMLTSPGGLHPVKTPGGYQQQASAGQQRQPQRAPLSPLPIAPQDANFIGRVGTFHHITFAGKTPVS